VNQRSKDKHKTTPNLCNASKLSSLHALFCLNMFKRTKTQRDVSRCVSTGQHFAAWRNYVSASATLAVGRCHDVTPWPSAGAACGSPSKQRQTRDTSFLQGSHRKSQKAEAFRGDVLMRSEMLHVRRDIMNTSIFMEIHRS